MMQWIGIPEDLWKKCGVFPGREIVSAYFCRSFWLEEVPDVLRLRMSAQDQFKLWVNGQAVLSGPCRGTRLCAYYDTLDIAPYVKKGKNMLAVEVVAYPQNPKDMNQIGPNYCYPGNEPLLAAESDRLPLSEAAAWHVQINCSRRWEYSYPLLLGAMERVTAGDAPEGWNTNEAVWGAFPTARSRGDGAFNVYGELRGRWLQERPIPLLTREEGRFLNEQVLTVPPQSTKKMVFDAGRITTAYFRLRVRGGEGARVRITYAESYKMEGENGELHKGLRDDPSGVIEGCADEYIASGQDAIYEPFLFRTFRFVEVQVTTQNAVAEVVLLPYIETTYPLKARAEISSKQRWMEDLWTISVNTLKHCMHDTYEDCPYYEQLQYAMDTRLEILFTYWLSGDTRLARRAIEDFSCSRMPDGLLQSRYPSNAVQVIPGFSLYWILMLEDYYWQTGDIEFIRKHMGTAQGIAEAFYKKIGPGGLVQPMGYWDFADWPKEWDAFHGEPAALKQGPSVLQNLLYVYALQSLSRLLTALQRKAAAVEYEKIAADILAVIEARCFDFERGMYREGEHFEQYSQHTQVWAVLTGLASGARAQEVLTHALEEADVVACSFVMQFYLFRALEKAGMYERTLPLWENWRRLLAQHCTTVPEKPEEPRSDCHAWGALPLYEFTAKLLGVEPLVPGWEEIRITPRWDIVEELSGCVPTPRGDVLVRWSRENSSVHITVQTPPQIPAFFYLPDGTREEISGGVLEKVIGL